MPKKGSKAKLKAKQKKQAKNRAQGKKSQQGKKNPNGASVAVDSKLDIEDPTKKIKEFIRDIHIHNFSLAPVGGGKPLIRGCDVRLIHEHRYGLIGYNGAGKTTFLKKLASGSMKEIPKYLRVMLVQQEMEGTDMTVMETVLKSDTERERLLAEEAKLRTQLERMAEDDEQQAEAAKAAKGADDDKEPEKNGAPKAKPAPERKETDEEVEKSIAAFEAAQDKLAEVTERLKFIGSDTAERRASTVLNGLLFTDRMKNMKTSDLSGGWRMRVSLACALFIQPDILLLDEPTNHLDFPSVVWLSDYLAYEYPPEKTIMIVSHDRRFLNDVCTDIIHLENGYLKYYTGNYESFMTMRRQRRIHSKKQYERQQKMIQHNERFIERFKANKKWSTQAQSRAKMLSKITRLEKVLDDLEFRFYFPEPPPLKNPQLFHLTDVCFGYFGEDDTRQSYLLDQVNLRMQMGTKVGILGANGAGKSTLVRLIQNELQPIRGTCALSNAVEVGFFAQHHMELLDYDATCLEHLKNVFGEATQQQIYAQLGRFGLGGDMARRRIGTLSGGQKSRVAFAILTWYSPHLVIMDEPTNHLDLPTIDGLAIALSDFQGSVIIVSHDQHFVETVCDEYWAVGNRDVRVFTDFEKCRNYCFKECPPVDVLPREFSSVEVKKRKYIPVKKKRAKEEKEQKEKPPAARQAEVFQVDPERAIDRGLEKGLTPDGILRHLRAWKPVDGNTAVVNKLGFIMFHDYFGSESASEDAVDFFPQWQKILQHCVPINHPKNQCQLVDITHACWKTAAADKNYRTQNAYSLGLILETMVNLEIINKDSVDTWKAQNASLMGDAAATDIQRFYASLEEAEEEESDSDSDF